MVVTFKDSIVVCFILDVPALEVEGFNWSGVGLIITNRSIVLSSRKYSAKIFLLLLASSPCPLSTGGQSNYPRMVPGHFGSKSFLTGTPRLGRFVWDTSSHFSETARSIFCGLFFLFIDVHQDRKWHYFSGPRHEKICLRDFRPALHKWAVQPLKMATGLKYRI